MDLAASLIIAYLLGSVPSGLIVGRTVGKIDIRRHGSGNIGAANVREALGWKSALAVMLLDAGKAALAVWLASWLGQELWPAAALAVIGHIYPVWLRFEGGKGLSCMAGAITAAAVILEDPLFLGILVVFAIIWFLFYSYVRDIDLANLAAAVAAAFASIAEDSGRGLFFVFAVIIIKHVQVLATGRHRSNA